MILGSRATAAASAAATSAASTRSSSPRNATTPWPSHSRVLKSALNIGEPRCFCSKAGSRPSGQFTFQHEQYAEHPAVSCPGGRRIYCGATPLSHQSAAAQHNRLREPRPGSPGHAHWLPDSMPAPSDDGEPSDLRPPARLARRRPGSASRWPRHPPPHRTHSHSPETTRASPGQDAPAQANSPPRPADPRHCARRAGPGRDAITGR
jgi:hypothetical protein